MTIHAMAATAAGTRLERLSYEPAPLRPDQVEIAVQYCGVCHSDLSMLQNHWHLTTYPFVPGHEVVGTISQAGPEVKGLSVGQRVGLGWFSGSCLHCNRCLAGDHNLCPSVEQTIVGRHGGFATRVRCDWEWATPLPDGIDPASAGPLFCGGITVFNPIVQLGIKPTDRVGVIGIGGLGHLALQFLNKWGCEVVAFTSSDAKRQEAMKLGAHRAVSSVDPGALGAIKGTLDMILVTADANMNWPLYLDALAPKGRLHLVGVVPDPIPAAAFTLIAGQKSISGSPLGSPATTRAMLAFAARHKINAITEEFPMSRATEAIAHLASGKARYRVVLKNDLG